MAPALNRAFTRFIPLLGLGAILANTSALAQQPVAYRPSIRPHVENPVENGALRTTVFIENLGQFDSRVLYQAKLVAQTTFRRPVFHCLGCRDIQI